MIRWYCWRERRSSFRSCSSSSSASSRIAHQVLVEVLVGELQLGDAVLVVERHRRAVLDRLPEVVDRDVVAEDLAGSSPRPAISGVPVKPRKRGVRQRVAHVQRERVVLAAVRLVGDDDDVGAVGEHRVRLALLGAELLDQREDVAVVLAEQLRAGARRSVAWHVLLGHDPGVERTPRRSGRPAPRGR